MLAQITHICKGEGPAAAGGSGVHEDSEHAPTRRVASALRGGDDVARGPSMAVQDQDVRDLVQKVYSSSYNGRPPPSADMAKEVEQIVRGVLQREQADIRRTAKLVARAIPLAHLVDDGRNGTVIGWNVSVLQSGHGSLLHVDSPAARLMEVAHLHPTSTGGSADRSPVLPTLFMPGFPKSATSWLYKCLLDSFSPSAVGCGTQASGWSAGRCRRRFAVTALQSDARGYYSEKKELFYFGGVRPDHQFRYASDLLNLHGPDPTGGSRLSELPPLWPWERQRAPGHVLRMRLRSMCRQAPPSQACKLERATGQGRCAQSGGGGNCSRACDGQPRCSNLGTYACETPHVERHGSFRGVCQRLGSSAALPSSGCGHPACVRVAPAAPQFSGQFRSCNWEPSFARPEGSQPGRSPARSPAREAFCTHSLLPWGRAGELNISVVDFTPNYICDADAMRRMHEGAAGQPDRLRFIVVMRDPIMRAFSEWAMFSLGWNWDPVKNFSASMAYKLDDLRKCNRSLFMRPDRLRALPTSELASYMRECFRFGSATMYATTSMYGVCMLHALRYFRREQFLVLRYEDLMRMKGPEILRALARFTGLHLNPRQLANPKCQPTRVYSRGGKAKGAKPKPKPNSYSSNSPFAAEMLQEAAAPLERFFGPYNALLHEIMGTSFGWGRGDHRKTPLSAAEKAIGVEQARQYREHLRRRQVGTQLKERAKANQVRAAAWARGLPAELPPRMTMRLVQRRGRLVRGRGKGRGMGRGRGAMPPPGAMSRP